MDLKVSKSSHIAQLVGLELARRPGKLEAVGFSLASLSSNGDQGFR